MPSPKVKSKLWVFKTLKEKCADVAPIFHDLYREKKLSGVDYMKVMDILNERMIDEQNKGKK